MTPDGGLVDPSGNLPPELWMETDSYVFEGHVDYYGHHVGAGGWFVGGWIAHPWPAGHRPQDAAAVFARMPVVEHSHAAFYHREDISGRGIGFVFFFPGASDEGGTPLSVQVTCGGVVRHIHPTPSVLCLHGQEIMEHQRGTLSGGAQGSQQRRMWALLVGEQPVEIVTGFVDSYGYHDLAGGWLLCGWVSAGWPQDRPPERITLFFDEGEIEGAAVGVLYPRHDLHHDGEGAVFFVSGEAVKLGRLHSVSFKAGNLEATLTSLPTTPKLREPDLIGRLRPILAQGRAGLERDILLGMLARQPYGGHDTLAALSTVVLVEIDEAILSGEHGLVLLGWLLARPAEIRAMRVRCGALSSPLVLDDCVRLDRADVLEAFSQHGFTDPRCGFVAYLPHAVMADQPIFIEVETSRHEIGYRTIPRPKLEGITAIKCLLATVDVRFGEVQGAFDKVLGPAIEGLNRLRLASRPEVRVVECGPQPASPRFSVIVPLHGRLDFVEYQMALFSAHPGYAGTEIIYVLDDPTKRREAQFLFASVYARFRIPFRALLLERNVGYAPANNIGLAHAHGSYVAFLNSDVFPGTLDWMEQLADRLVADPGIGAIGPTLLYEDGSVQHRGMFFKRLPEFGDWFFGMHMDKGLRHVSDGTLEPHLSITGACIFMTRALAEELGGFDEVYVIGDFEDSDMCLKLAALGYKCVVDPKVVLYHLERKSQASSALGWRLNLTVYNAWQHQRRWGETIARLQDA